MNFYENIKIIEKDSPLFPNNLKVLNDCPSKLYLLGNENILNKTSISIVGTRRSSAFGNELATEFAEKLSQNDIVIVSRRCRRNRFLCTFRFT